MNAEDLVIPFKKNMANPSKTERCRAIESVRGAIRTAIFDDVTGSSHEIECCSRCESVAIVKRERPRMASSATSAGTATRPSAWTVSATWE